MTVLFAEQTPVNLIAKIRPDIYVKGGDYEIDRLDETRLVKTWGGKAIAIPFLYEYFFRQRRHSFSAHQ